MAMEFKASRSIPSVQATQWHDLLRWGQSALVLWRPSIAGGDSKDQPTNRIVGRTSFHEAKRQIFCHHPADRHLSFDLLLALAKAFEMGRKSPETSVSHRIERCEWQSAQVGCTMATDPLHRGSTST
jgi:hypothetical protein